VPIDPDDRRICTSIDVQPEPGGSPVSEPIAQTSLFTFPTYDALLAALGDEYRTTAYTRGRNPTVMVLEKKLAELERGESCKVLASGMAAISATMLGLVRQGEHILFANQVYGPALQLAHHLRRFGVDHDHVVDCSTDSVRAMIKPDTRLLWLESPGTMTFQSADIAALASIAKENGALTVMDNTWATPLFQKPLLHGVDLVVHSCSKYIGGHSDVVAGAVIGDDKVIEEIFYKAFLLNGAAIGPVDAWLTTRALRTLPVRMLQHEKNGLALASFLEQHQRVARVNHPCFDPHPELVSRQLSGRSGLFSFELQDAGFEKVRELLNRLRVFRIGISWGGIESLAVSPNRGDNADALRASGIPPGLVRLSAGQEDADMLIADLDQALLQ